MFYLQDVRRLSHWQEGAGFLWGDFFVIAMTFPLYWTEKAGVSVLFDTNGPNQENK
jgi:hypothetical protein